jgi:hypothetical protein
MKRLLTFAVLLLTVQFSFATVHHVPDTYSTIQTALNACSTGDTVFVAPGTYYENILWPGTQGIVLKSELGAAVTIINGGGSARVIRISSGVGNTTIIDGFTIKNGYAETGGGISCAYNSSPTIKNNSFMQNIAYGTVAKYGGGGGIAVGYNSSPVITYNVFKFNSATASAGGGLICAFNSNPIINNNSFENNSASTGGGAIFIHDGCSATITNNQVRYNTSQMRGGGMFFQGSSSTVKFNTIENNTANETGGGIEFGQMDVSLIDSNTIKFNTALLSGGGIGMHNGSKPTISNNIIANNSADSTGGGIFCFDNSNGKILHNILKYNEARYGGGIHCYHYSNPTITGNTIDSNLANISSGGIRCKSYSSPQILNNTITYNVVEDSLGGGIGCVEYSSPEIMYNTIRHNKAELGGGGIVCYDNSSPAIKYNSIDSNNVTSGYGGGLFCGENSRPDIVGNNFSDNDCTLLGGDIFVWWGCTVKIDSNEIHGSNSNQSLSSLFIVGTSSVVSYNSITNHAGNGIRLWADYSNIYNNEIAGNDTGVVCVVGSNPTINYNYDPSVTVNASNNWWGDPKGPGGLGPGAGDEVSKFVDYDPWLTNSITNVESESDQTMATDYVLFQNYPNPFNPVTTISYGVPVKSHITIKVYNVLGKEVVTLVNEEQASGKYQVVFNAINLASGIYFYKLHAGDFIKTKKMVLTK